ncbi:hypothetical protein VP409E501_P0058 [Vibrio phage 409E50-1]|nr:hypothetical protein VP521E561_P0058 [Vibrio phage 521E56-1]CAH9012704.1 hypothetical protein VP464E531_P0056 [Vibrio phage 464E53-1]CAH9012808.1 hypothetical protein VP384E501_P0058 [Vibrio phage 384E50-1]CAH9012846.1 hypothetical protein VP409E501_P0058 [Vibrio phage 409E50-1]CAH9012869.1 hypothetical protein VP402E501_P0058 [Vibrio phage 402E50-1]CAH9013695.1 hypothetical protein VP405E501_P0058 [Vibrio phage 405E50-1]CAH9013758.1 hypothetical protein VP413E501_P0058 [Vibrio phage 413E5
MAILRDEYSQRDLFLTPVLTRCALSSLNLYWSTYQLLHAYPY